MNCPICQSESHKCGRNRNGSQCYRCGECGLKFTDESTRPIDRRRLSRDKVVMILRMLLEGMSVRSVERLTEVHRDTVIATMVEAGESCERFMERAIRLLPASDVQADEIWGFIGCKEKTKMRNGYGEDKGDAWCFVGIERMTKLILAWHLGKRTPGDTLEFTDKLRHATTGRFQLSTDGFRPYKSAVRESFGETVDYAQLIKVYATPEEGGPTRYSPSQVIDTYSVIQLGNPDEDRICTSHSERSNLSIRMACRRMTRLTNAYSKKWQNHGAALALWFGYYNYCRSHETLNERNGVKTTPAMESGLTDHVWTVEELLERAAEIQ
jgi:transposase-like protein/IS1 family transposase